MGEVNAAWDVLRSPADRAAYDDQLRLATAVGSTARSSSLPPSFDGQLVDPQRIDPRVGGVSRRRGRWLPVLIVLVLVAGGVVVALLVASHRAARIDEPVVRTNRYEVGSWVAARRGPGS
jgi:hypothetical protein